MQLAARSRQVINRQDTDWCEMAEGVVRKVYQSRARQEEGWKNALLSTGDADLVAGCNSKLLATACAVLMKVRRETTMSDCHLNPGIARKPFLGRFESYCDVLFNVWCQLRKDRLRQGGESRSLHSIRGSSQAPEYIFYSW